MNDDLNLSLPQGEPPDAETLKRISARMTPARAVHPLPSNGVLLTISLALFALISFVLAALVKFKAFASLSALEMALYYGTVSVFAVFFARAVIERMIPGEKRWIRSSVLWIAALAVLGILMGVLFTDHSTVNFVASGIPCLRLGVISALVSGVIGWRSLRRGYLVSPTRNHFALRLLCWPGWNRRTGAALSHTQFPTLSCLASGAMVLAGIAGLFVGRYFENAD